MTPRLDPGTMKAAAKAPKQSADQRFEAALERARQEGLRAGPREESPFRVGSKQHAIWTEARDSLTR